MSWQVIMDVVALMPRLQRLESGYNRLQSLSSPLPDHTAPALTTLNFDTNQLADWAETCHALASFPKLVRLVLSSNPFESVPVPAGAHIPLKWTNLSLSSTRISEWSSIDSLNVWCPELESLSLSGSPLVGDPHVGRVWQQIAIARLPRLRILDGTSSTTTC